MSDGTVTDDDKKYCESVAKSISDVIRFSLNEDFRKRSCELFGVFSTKDAEKEMSRRLMSMLKNKSTGSRKKKKKLSKEQSKENEDEQNITFAEKTTNKSSNTNTDGNSQTFSENAFRKNWLQISSQRYREVVKRKSLQFFSQPQDVEPLQKSLKFSTCNLHFSNSQPISEVPSSSCNPCNFPNNGINFCKKRSKSHLKRILKNI